MEGRLVLVMLLAAFVCLGSAQPVPCEETGEKTSEKDSPSPSLELLAFLADFKTRDGEFVDPMALRAFLSREERVKE